MSTAMSFALVTMSGCTNYYSIDITVSGAGTVVLTTSMHFWIDHTAGVQDGYAFGHRTDPTDCNAALGSPPMYADEVVTTAPTDNLMNRAGTQLNVYSVAGAGTYTYYVNAYMWNGESASDSIRIAETVAVFYPS